MLTSLPTLAQRATASSSSKRLPTAFLGSGVTILTNQKSSILIHSISKLTPSAARPRSCRNARLFFRATATAGAPQPTTQRLEKLRNELRKRDVHAMIIPSVDPHFSEYAPLSYTYRNFISNFTGSSGTAVVTLDGAYLWTDGRYFLQAANQLDSNWTLMKAGLPDTPTIPKFLGESLPNGSVVGIDPFLHSMDFVNMVEEAVVDDNIRLVHLESNPVEIVWGKERPPLPSGFVRVHDIRYAGESVDEKLQSIRESMEKKNCDHMLLSMLDEVCWLYNIRGSDVLHSPVVMSYALISKETSCLYIDLQKLNAEVREHLSSSAVDCKPYEEVVDDLRHAASREQKVWIDPKSTSVALRDAVGKSALGEATPVKFSKARKNEAEIQGMREAHIRDGVALSSFLCWLEDLVNTDGQTISEAEAALKLREFRAKQDGFMDESFQTIAGSGANGAIIHHNPLEGNCGQINNTDLFLLDSGGQYVDGTTDVTRTMHLGHNATEYEKECFTRVLQGHIGIDTAVFPEDTTGLMLDALARIPLWRIGLDYRHGTGHGVGACLNVHEGPHSISPRISSNYAGLKEGMIVSNEPGYYEDGKFGIRIENLLCIVKRQTKRQFGGKQYLGFDRLTYVPIAKSMVEWSLMSSAEIEWLNSYHAIVWEKLSPRMENGSYKDWLRERTRPVALKEMQQESSLDNASRVTLAT